MCDATSDVSVATGVPAESNSVASGVETQTQKRVVKLTAKALSDKSDRLQTGRTAKFNKENNIRKSLQGFIQKGVKIHVYQALEELIEVCDDAKCMHESLLGLLPHDERDKHEMWFTAKTMLNDECIPDAKMCVQIQPAQTSVSIALRPLQG